MNPDLQYPLMIHAILPTTLALAFFTCCSQVSAHSGEPGTLLTTHHELLRYPSGDTNIIAVSARSNPLFLRSHSIVNGISNVIAVAAGYTHNLALIQDGTVRQWGSTNMPPVPSDLTNAIAVAAGENFSCALRADGTIAAWGRRFVLATNVPPGLSNVVAIAAGEDHVLALTQTGDVVAWGSNSFGQTNVPPAVTNISFIAAARAVSIAATSNGILWRWGEGAGVPGHTNIARSIKQIAATRVHTFALDEAGNLIPPPAARIPWNVTNLAGIFCSDSNLYAIARGPVLRSQQYPLQYPPEVISGGGGVDGRNVAMAVVAESYHPFVCHWFFNGAPLPGATDTLLRLTGLRSANSGTYFAMVSNIYGTMTSAPVRISISTVCDETPSQAVALLRKESNLAFSMPRLTFSSPGAIGAGSSGQFSISESAAFANFTASLDRPSSNPVSFNWRTSDGTAFDDRHYYAATGHVIFPPLVTNQTFQVRLRNDQYYETNRTFYIGVTNIVGAFSSITQLTCTIFDDEFIVMPPGFTYSPVASVGFGFGGRPVTSMAFAPDGRIFVCSQHGWIRVVKPGMFYPLPEPFTILGGQVGDEAGVLGIAFDPGFHTNSFLYVYYTHPRPDLHNRISRLTARGDVVDPCSEKILREIEPPRSSTAHLGGALHFGPDGKLYAAVGDHGSGWAPQSLSSLAGKILRINPDGTIPEDNPFYSVASGPHRAIWATGLRNPFTFAMDPVTGRMLINNVGSRWEEVNEGFPGANFGWPYEEGAAETNVFTNPVYAYPTGPGVYVTNCAVIGAALYNPPRRLLPVQYVGSYFFGDHCSGWIRRLDTNGVVHDFASRLPGGLVDIDVGPDGALYTLTLSGGILRFAAPSMFLSARRLPDHRVQLHCVGAPNDVYVLESSSNLSNWQPIATNQSPAADFEFYDPLSPNSPQRFYRLRH